VGQGQHGHGAAGCVGDGVHIYCLKGLRCFGTAL